jgi:hypothetical protein
MARVVFSIILTELVLWLALLFSVSTISFLYYANVAAPAHDRLTSACFSGDTSACHAIGKDN